MADTSAVLRVSGLRFAYPGMPPLFDGVGFALPAGLTRLDIEVGKSTLLRLMAGELRSEGRWLLNGQPWQPGTDLATGSAAVFWLDPRDAALDDSAPDQVAAAVRPRHPAWRDEVWDRSLSDFGLDEHRHKTMHMLSTGSRRKVMLAAALAAGASLTLLDEPTAGLDQPSIEALARALAGLAVQPGRAWLLAAAWGLEQRLPWTAVLEV